MNLTLRRFTSSDLDFAFEMLKDPKVMQYTRYRVPQTTEQIQASLERWIQDDGVWLVEAGANSVGWVMLKMTEFQHPEIGFMLPQSCWGRGIATELVRMMVEKAFGELGFSGVVALTDIENEGSQKVLRKNGFWMSEGAICASKPVFLFEVGRE